ncbi:hypothetical protein TSAR_016196 [Trichomalopsis sarcophagae]|uniref:Uncharacterized protein n=1 Tax=Trichomalopsis sarcophagae TaxID=543379 RepID=A0A232EMV9_9HYME|nr:hypothetical protein TSAR_016196 [Trichomalopsis sarcophagae]
MKRNNSSSTTTTTTIRRYSMMRSHANSTSSSSSSDGNTTSHSSSSIESSRSQELNITGVYSQSGEGKGEEENPRFIIESNSTLFYRRIGYDGRGIRGILPEPPMNADFHSRLEGWVRDLHRQLCERSGPSNVIGVTINSEQFSFSQDIHEI